MKRLLVLLLAVAFFGPVALAASRTWKSADGRFSTEAELLGVKDGKAQLKKTDGKVIEVPLAVAQRRGPGSTSRSGIPKPPRRPAGRRTRRPSRRTSRPPRRPSRGRPIRRLR